MPNKTEQRKIAEKDFKDRNEWIKKQNEDVKKRTEDQAQEEKEFKEETYEKTVHAIEKFERPTHRSTFMMPKLYKGKKN